MEISEKKEKLFRTLSKTGTVMFWAGLASSIYTLVTVYVLSGSLLTGACPIAASGPWPYISIVLLALSFLLSLFDRKDKKKVNETHS